MQSVADLGFLPGGGANSKVEPKKLLFSQFLKKKNCMKLKEFGPREAHVLGTLLSSANSNCNEHH